jgi:anti-anti-sigma factor
MSQAHLVSLQGALTILCGQAQRESLMAALEGHPGNLLLDLSGIEAFDSAGVQLLLATRRSLEERGASLVLHDVAPAVRDVLETYGLHGLLPRPEAA